MNFEPEKFFISLMDFFSILLPGALLTYLLMDKIGPVVIGYEKYHQIADAEGVAAFLVTSYLFGHLIFLLGSGLDELYDWLRRRTLNYQIKILAQRGKLLPWILRVIVWLIFKRERDLAVDRVSKIKRHKLAPLHAGNVINNFQWSKALLSLESPSYLTNIQRLEADSKFFRCFVVVLLILVVTWPLHQKWPFNGIAVVLVLLLLALWRYLEQRFKAINQAYWSVITYMAQRGQLDLDKNISSAGHCTHSGGVVFRFCNGEAEVLLVEAKNDPKQWVLPKGHIEPDEQAIETAVREVHEETGVWARISKELPVMSFMDKGTKIIVQFYLMEYVGCGLRQDMGRKHEWFPIAKGLVQASYLETRELLSIVASELEKVRKHRKDRSCYCFRCLKRFTRIIKVIFKGRSAPKLGG